MIAPCIHLNGTSKQELLDQFHKALHALEVARAALMAACPNARDYYPLGGSAWHQAVADHRSRVQRLDSVYAELEAILLAII